VCAGTRPLDDPARAVVGAIREALTNTARHADVRRVSVFTEAADAELIAVVRDRGRGFDPVAVPGDRRGIADSIVDRVRRSGGAARVHSAVGEGTEVELHMPVTEPTQPSTMDGAGAGR